MSIRDWLTNRGAAAMPEVARLQAVNRELAAANARLTETLARKLAAEAALAQGEAYVRASFETAAVGQVHYDPVSGVIVRANQAYADMLGYAPEELVGRRGSDFTYPEDKDPAPYARMVDGEVEIYAREKRYVRRDGTTVWGRVSASMARDPVSNAPLLAVAIVEDVDAYHRTQAALSQAKQALEFSVEQLTAALAQRDLLLREVYHRVKNNLQIVDGLLLLQSRRLSDPEAVEALQGLRGRVFALGLVHHQLMGSDDLETFDVAPFLEELSQHLLEGAGTGAIALTVRAQPLRAGLDFAIPLGLLVTELVTHSMKHALPDDTGAIEVSLEIEASGHVLLQVSHDRQGVAGAPDAGSLGANIVEGLVRQLRGELTVGSEGGVRTRVRLPAPATERTA